MAHFFAFFSLFILASTSHAESIHLTMTAATKTVGEELLVSCRDGSGQLAQWTGLDGKPLGPKTHPQVGKASYGTWLYFTQVQRHDSGTYTCSTATSEARFTLTVEGFGGNNGEGRVENEEPKRPSWKRPNKNQYSRNNYNNNNYFGNEHGGNSGSEDAVVFKDTPPKQYAEEHSNYTIRCETTGKTLITFTRLDGSEIIQTSPRFKTLGDGLFVMDASIDDSGIYVCRAVQATTGIVKEQNIVFTVQHKPYPVHGKQENIWGYLGSQVNLTCQVQSNPQALFKWYRQYPTRKIDIGNENEIIRYHNESVLILNFSDKSIIGHYICEASNQMGMTEIHYDVEMGERPKVPKSLELRGRNHDFLDVGVIESEETYDMDGMEPKWFLFKYRHFEETEWQEREFEKSEENSYLLEDLEKSSTYEIKVASKNIAGISEFTRNSSYFETLSEPSGSQTFTPQIIATILLPILSILAY